MEMEDADKWDERFQFGNLYDLKDPAKKKAYKKALERLGRP